jgi:hypothetical protein
MAIQDPPAHDKLVVVWACGMIVWLICFFFVCSPVLGITQQSDMLYTPCEKELKHQTGF